MTYGPFRNYRHLKPDERRMVFNFVFEKLQELHARQLKENCLEHAQTTAAAIQGLREAKKFLTGDSEEVGRVVLREAVKLIALSEPDIKVDLKPFTLH